MIPCPKCNAAMELAKADVFPAAVFLDAGDLPDLASYTFVDHVKGPFAKPRK